MEWRCRQVGESRWLKVWLVDLLVLGCGYEERSRHDPHVVLYNSFM